MRLWLLCRPGDRLHASVWTSLLFAAVCVAIWTGFVWLQAQPDPQFVSDALPLLAWYALAAVSMAALLHWRSRPKPHFLEALSLVLGLAPLLLLLTIFGWDRLGSTGLSVACLLACAYSLFYLSRGLRAFSGARQAAAAVIGVAYLAAFLWLSEALAVVPALFAPLELSAPEASADGALADEEAIFFAQSGRIDRGLAAMQGDGGSGAPRAFFLGFAGVGDEKVFSQEIFLAARVVGDRFDIGTNSLALINDERDLQRAPLASVSSLRYALQGIAAKMNTERDVLFLVISSHGAQDPAIIVANSGLPLDDLTPQILLEALQSSGIKRRVVIISACYAGGFIEALKGPGSIVMTAAAADRTSFGCGTDSELTYFGEAFFKDALPRATSLRDAFDRARAAISARERREHVDASRPQGFFDPDLESTLATMMATRGR